MPRILILGTGTGVGKTSIACALITQLRNRSRDAIVVGIKPIETGITDRGRSDGLRLSSASTVPSPSPLYQFPDPVSPHLAAERAGTKIETTAIATQLSALPYTTLPDTWLVLEGAGGAFTPLSAELVNLDLIEGLGIDQWVLVVSDRLGALHDTRTTLLAAESTGSRPPIVVLRRPAESDASTGTNASELRKIAWANPIDGPTDAVIARLLADQLEARTVPNR